MFTLFRLTIYVSDYFFIQLINIITRENVFFPQMGNQDLIILKVSVHFKAT